MGMEQRGRFEALYSRHAPAVKAYVLRRGGDSDADDLVTEVFLVCLRRFDEIPTEPLPWLLSVARRVLSTHRRGERRRNALKERIALESSDVLPLWDGLDPVLAGALRGLSEADRELLLLIAWEGLSPSQAAAALGLNPAAVRVRLYRARSRFITALKDTSAEHSCSALPKEASNEA
jgi:RNA polymerase sigma-70 factor (ECF subfamily)